MNVKIISLEATFKTVLVDGRTDMFRETVPDWRSGNWERSLTEPGPCPGAVKSSTNMWEADM